MPRRRGHERSADHRAARPPSAAPGPLTPVRAGRFLLAAGALLLVAIAAAVAVLPGMLDWNRYRDDIAALASRGIGRPVRIDGNVSLSLLPQPVLTASGMTVADRGDGISLRADALRFRVSLGALLAGRVDARELVLHGADLRLPWPPAPGALAQRPPSWLSGLQARVEASRLQVGNVVFTDIAGTLSTDADTGLLSANGAGTIGAQSWRVIARLGAPGGDGSAALDASIDGEGALRDTGGTFSGEIGADGALAGRATGRGPDLSLLLPAPALPWTGEGRLTASAGLAVADELQMVLGGTPARGALALRVGPDARLDVALASNRLDLDAWWPVLLRGAAPAFPTGVDLSAETATFAGGQLRRVRAGLDLGPNGAVVREAAAELPGAATVMLAGSAGRDGGFRGAGQLSAPDLRATLRWLEPSVPGLAALRPDTALATGQLSATVTAENGVLGLSDLRGVVDGASVTGTASFRPGARPSLTGELRADRLVLDPWLPELDGRDDLFRLQRRFAAFDMALKVDAPGASWHSLPISSASVDVTAENGRVTVRRLQATVRGVQLALSGAVGDGARLSDGALDASTNDAASLAALLPASWAVLTPLVRGPGTVSVRGAGSPDALTLRVTADVSDVHVEARPVVDASNGRLSGPVTFHHPGAPRLLRLFGLQGLAAAVGDGSLFALATVSAAPGEIRFDTFQVSAGTARVGGQVTIAQGAEPSVSGRVGAESLPAPAYLFAPGDPLPTALLRGWRANLRLQAAQVTWNGQTVATEAGSDVSLAGAVLVLRNGRAAVGGGQATWDATVDGSAEPPRFAMAGAVDGAVLNGPVPGLLPVSVGSGTLGMRFDLHAAGHSPAALLATVEGEARVALRNGVLYGLDLPGATAAAGGPVSTPSAVLAAVRAALTGGNGPFATLDGTVKLVAGQATLADATLTDSAGAVDLSGTAFLPDGTLDLRLSRPAIGSAPGYAVRITGTRTELVRTPELAGLARELAETGAPP